MGSVPDRSNSPPIERFVALVGLPRSGTTLLTALLDAHPSAAFYYEPYNSQKKRPPAVPSDLTDFCHTMQAQFGIPLPAGVRVVGFKETTILPESTAWAIETVEALAPKVPTHVVWIVRDPIHCFLSKLEAARKWWGFPDAALSAESLQGFLAQTGPSLRALEGLAERTPATLVSYDSLVADAAGTLDALMPRLGLSFEPAQLDYHEQGPRPAKVMGDPEVSRDPQPVSADRSARRAAEHEEHRALVEEVLAREEHAWIRAEFERLARVEGVEPRD